MLNILCIALGGAIGALLRFYLSTWAGLLLSRGFPYGTLLVNVIGSFLIGVLFVLLTVKWALPVYWRLGLLVGLLGAFTTFSAFSIETLVLVEAGEHLTALLNVLTNVALCLLACWAGLAVGRAF